MSYSNGVLLCLTGIRSQESLSLLFRKARNSFRKGSFGSSPYCAFTITYDNTYDSS
jgi:hypothetical protein